MLGPVMDLCVQKGSLCSKLPPLSPLPPPIAFPSQPNKLSNITSVLGAETAVSICQLFPYQRPPRSCRGGSLWFALAAPSLYALVHLSKSPAQGLWVCFLLGSGLGSPGVRGPYPQSAV